MCVPLLAPIGTALGASASSAAAVGTAATATALAGAYSAYTQYQSGAAQNKYYNYMADNARQEGEYALRQGQAQSTAIQDQAKLQGKQLARNQAEFTASQRAAMAAAGLTGVTAEDISSDTFTKESLDKSLLLYNANIKSWESKSNAAYKSWASNVQADQYSYQGKSAKYAGKTNAFGTLLATAGAVASIGALAPAKVPKVV